MSAWDCLCWIINKASCNTSISWASFVSFLSFFCSSQPVMSRIGVAFIEKGKCNQKIISGLIIGVLNRRMSRIAIVIYLDAIFLWFFSVSFFSVFLFSQWISFLLGVTLLLSSWNRLPMTLWCFFFFSFLLSSWSRLPMTLWFCFLFSFLPLPQCLCW